MKANLIKINLLLLRAVLFIIIALSISISHASFMGLDTPLDKMTNYSLYNQCIYGWNLDVKRTPNILTVRTIGNSCYNTCQKSCAATFGITQAPDNTQNQVNDPAALPPPLTNEQLSKNSGDNQQNLSVNRDLIENCLRLCQQGQKYSGPVRTYDVSDNNSLKPYKDDNAKTADEKLWVGSCSTSAYDSNSADYAFYTNNSLIKAGDKYRITIVSKQNNNLIGDGETNTLYMCGYKTIYIYPDVYSTKQSDSVWGSVSKSTSYTNKGPSVWNAKNSSWYNTTIDAKDDDYLEIIYGGRFHHACNDSTNDSALCQKSDYDYNLQIKGTSPKNDTNGASWKSGFNSNDDVILPSDKIKSTILDIPNDASETAQKNAIVKDNALSVIPKMIGLKGSIILDNRLQKYLYDRQFVNLMGPPTYNSSLYRVNIFSGYLQGFSSKFRRLGIRHYDAAQGQNTSNWFDNVGGYFVNVIWKGCKYQDGERLQYAVIPSNLIDKNQSSSYSVEALNMLYNDKSWQDLVWSKNQGNGESKSLVLDFQSDGYVFFRIKPLHSSEYANFVSGCSVTDPLCNETFGKFNDKSTYDRFNTIGSYDIRVDAITTDENWLVKIIKQIRTVLFGPSMASGKGNAMQVGDGGQARDYGIVQQIFIHTVQDSRAIDAIRALLILYVAYTGLMFIMGMAKINQKEGISRILRISIVVTLIGPTSWNFFYNNFFAAFIGGMNWLIDSMSYMDDRFFKTQTANDFSPIIIAHFNDFLSYVTDNDVLWAKVFALMFSSLTGFMLGIVILMAVISFMIAIVRATLIYIFSLLIISILIILSPLFISFLLFNYTKQLFDAWLKQMVSSVFQPVLLFSVISLFNQIIIVMIYTATSFTICKTCWFGFYFFGIIDVCFIGKYRPLISSHNPDPFSGPLTQFTMIISLLIIVLATQTFCKAAPAMAGRLINWMSVTGSGSIRSISDPIVSGLTFFPRQALWLAGLDKESMGKREKMRKDGDKPIVRR